MLYHSSLEDDVVSVIELPVPVSISMVGGCGE